MKLEKFTGKALRVNGKNFLIKIVLNSNILLVLDATEPYKSRIVYPLLCVYDNELFLNDFETNQYRVVNVKEQFKCTSFNNI